MAETSSISDPNRIRASERTVGYRAARDVRARAAVLSASDSPAVRKSLDRLDHILSSGRPLRSDVPRGYYLNILV